MYFKYYLCEATGRIKWHEIQAVTNRRSIFVIHSNFFLYINAITEVPTNVAVQYNHRLAHTPDNNAGANERAGFIDAPDIKAKNKISSPTITPIATPPNPFKPFV